MIVVMMGVAGSGKTFVGMRLAERLRWEFFDADDLHSHANVAKMSAGIPLDDADRAPWLNELQDLLRRLSAEERNAVLACSALRREFRDALRSAAPDLRFVYLKGDRSLIGNRLRTRQGHFLGPELLDSQFQTMEEPAEALAIDASEDVGSIVEQIVAAIGSAR